VPGQGGTDNRLVEVSNSADPDDTSFVYGADGVRVKRAQGDEATYYIGPIEIETDDGDVTETHSIYGLGGGVNAVRVVASAGDDGEVTFAFGDHLGSSSTVWQAGELGDTDQGLRSFQRYYPYGEPRDTYNPNLPTNHTFTGQITDGLLDDGGTGLMYYQARYYDPQTGRFAAADTIIPNPANPQDLNRFTYVGSNPVNAVDPNGHCDPDDPDCHIGGVRRTTSCVLWDSSEHCIARDSAIVSPETAQEMFEAVDANSAIYDEFLYEGCWERAYLSANTITATGHSVIRIGVLGPLQIQDPYDDYYPNYVILEGVPDPLDTRDFDLEGNLLPPGSELMVLDLAGLLADLGSPDPALGPPGFVHWGKYHIATAMLVGEGSDDFDVWAIDTGFGRPFPVADWAAALGADLEDVQYMDASIYGWNSVYGWSSDRPDYMVAYYELLGDVCHGVELC
jgi:RHS repeat-associated protein